MGTQNDNHILPSSYFKQRNLIHDDEMSTSSVSFFLCSVRSTTVFVHLSMLHIRNVSISQIFSGPEEHKQLTYISQTANLASPGAGILRVIIYGF
mmetsp:Transcript_2093/g.3132  ORF Transcript_2093/g.3132 Transcript_2093/m.3132 type:complete len:95 (+) Transcript_2093:96-380(+)